MNSNNKNSISSTCTNALIGDRRGGVMEGRKYILRLILFSLCSYMCIYLCMYTTSKKVSNIGLYKKHPSRELNYSEGFDKNGHVKTTNCTMLTRPIFTGDTSDWQDITSNDTVYVYSAHMVDNSIRIIGLIERKNLSLFCQIWSRDVEQTVSLITTDASVFYIPQAHEKR